jgi:hypothetical protein
VPAATPREGTAAASSGTSLRWFSSMHAARGATRLSSRVMLSMPTRAALPAARRRRSITTAGGRTREAMRASVVTRLTSSLAVATKCQRRTFDNGAYMRGMYMRGSPVIDASHGTRRDACECRRV